MEETASLHLRGTVVVVWTTLILFILKMEGLLRWAWPWVLSPLWVELILITAAGAAVLVRDRRALNKQRQEADRD